jgi:hypothetical protein
MRLIGPSPKFFFIAPLIPVFFGLIFLIAACNTSKENSSEVGNNNDSLGSTEFIKKVPPTDSIIEKITCEDHPQFSYSLLVPNNYQAEKTCPLVIFFDPHAAGDLPLKKYRALANQFGFIFAGSNNSKNNLNPPGAYAEIYKALRTDLEKKLNIQKNRIYLVGFSGGARVALNLGLADNSVAGVIANSAGFDPANAPLRDGFVVYGFAGDEDFNLLEQKRTEKNLQQYPSLIHQLAEFNGKHEWAPLERMRDAFIFLECAARYKKISTATNTNVEDAYQSLENQLKKTKDKKLRLKLLQNTSGFSLAGICSKAIQREAESVSKSDFAKQLFTEEEKADAEETVLQNNYAQKVFTESADFWNATVANWEATPKNNSKYKLNCRLQSYISMVVYISLQSPEGKQNVLLREKLLLIYELVDPKNSEWAYLKAVLRAQQGNREEALRLLNECVKLNFNDKQRVNNQSEFSSLLFESGFPSSLK